MKPVDVTDNPGVALRGIRPSLSTSPKNDISPAEALPHLLANSNKPREHVFVPLTRSGDGSLQFNDYQEYSGPPGGDPRIVNMSLVSEGIVRIVEVEGPIVVKRAYDIYLRACGIQRMRSEVSSTMNRALAHAIRQGRLVAENESSESGLLFSVARVSGSLPIVLRRRGPRSLQEIPPSEVQVVAMYLAERHDLAFGSDEHLRAILECFDLKRLTTQAGTRLLEILDKKFPYVHEFLRERRKRVQTT